MSPAFGLEVTNTPGTAKVLGLNLTEPVFFKREIFCFTKKWSAYYCYYSRLSCHIVFGLVLLTS